MSLTNLFNSLLTNLILKLQINKNVALVNLSIYYTWKNIKSAYNNNKFKISAPTWNNEFDLLDRSYSISDIQDYFEFIIKKHETLEIGYKLELLSLETMKLLGSTKQDVDKVKDREDLPKLESAEVVLVHCNLVNNS